MISHVLPAVASLARRACAKVAYLGVFDILLNIEARILLALSIGVRHVV